MEIVTVRFQENVLKNMDKAIKKHNYNSRTEFIRECVRKRLEENKLREAMASIAHLKGASKKRISDEEIEKAREKAFDEIAKKLR